MKRLLSTIAISLVILSVRGFAQEPVPTFTVSPTGERQLIVIVTPPFKKTGVSFQTDPFASVIQRDLVMSGFFASPSNEQFAKENMTLDAAKNKINAEAWRQIGVHFVVSGTYRINGNEILAEVSVLDTAGLEFVFGKKYSKFAQTEARILAHTISNDIIKQLTTFQGVANTQICFVRASDRTGRSKRVYIMDADGGNEYPITPEGELTATPCWGAMGTEIYYTTWRDHNPDLAGFMMKTGLSWWVSHQPGLNLSPSWSEARQRVALTLTKDGNSEIYLVNRDGKNLTRLTNNPVLESSPAWSPDGSQLAFTSGPAGSPQIYIMDASGGGRRRLTHEGNYNDGPAWSPDGKTIAFTSRVGGKSQIAVINVDGSGFRVLTSGSNNESPTWAPNGLLLAFSSDRDGVPQIYTMFVDGTSIQRLTSGNGACTSPDWGPMR